ncbi:MAG: ACT domain-containing protein [Nanoarchaeota archaeon]
MAIKDLNELIKNMQPELVDKGFVFCTTNKSIDIKIAPKMVFREKEGTTLILKKEQAEEYNLKYEGVWDMITLNVNSDLEATGFLVKITEVLAKAKISINAVSAYYHDYLFVPSSKSEEAIKILKESTNQ